MPFPTPKDLHYAGIKPMSPALDLLHWQVESLPLAEKLPEKPCDGVFNDDNGVLF